jgi:hypothetical protein
MDDGVAQKLGERVTPAAEVSTHARGRRGEQRSGRRALRGLVIVAVALAAWGLLATLGRHSFFPNADSASSILAGRSMWSGNVFLRHWQMPLDSYWSEELVLFGLYSRIAGLGFAPGWAVPAAVTVALGFVVATLVRAAGHARRLTTVATVAMIAFVLTPIGLPSLVEATFGLQGPTHLETLVLCLAAFALLEPSRPTTAQVTGVALLGLTLVGDPSAFVLGAVPVALAGLAYGVRHRRWRPAVVAVAAVVAATALAGVLRLIAIGAGGYAIARLQPSATQGRWLANLHMVPHYVDLLFGGAKSTPHVWAGPALAQLTRTFTEAVFVASVAFAVVSALRRLVDRGGVGSSSGGWIDDVVLAALLCDVGFFVLAAVPPVDINSIRYLLPLLPLASILTGRTIARLLGTIGPAATAAAALTASAVFVGGVIGYRHQVVAPRPMREQAGVARWLEQHRMSEGIAGYWDAAPITLLTKGRVHVRATEYDGTRLVVARYLSDGDAIQRDHGPLNFVVASGPDRTGNVTTATAIATFGAPASSVVVGQFTIMMWDYDLSNALLSHAARG